MRQRLEETDPLFPNLTDDDDRRFDAALATVRQQMGRSHALWIDGRDHPTRHERVQHAPFDRGLVLGGFAAATPLEAGLAVEAAARAFPAWNGTAPADRRGVIRRVLQRMEDEAFALGAILALEVGKPRREAMREAWGTAALLVTYCDEWASHGWGDGPDPRGTGYGPWAVFAPFHHPLAFSAGPAAAALLAGNTVVIKAPEQAAWATRRFVELLHEVGLPPGVCNLVMGTPDDLGDALLADVRFAGATYVGAPGPARALEMLYARTRHPRPLLAQVTRKAARIVTARGDLPAAAASVARAAFGMAGQRPSAPSHVFVHHDVADAFLALLVAETRALHVGDPTMRGTDVGPLCSAADVRAYRDEVLRLHTPGAQVLCGGEVMAGGGLGAGNFVAPTVAEVSRDDHPAWPGDLMAPVLLARRYDDEGALVRAVVRLRRGHAVRVHGAPEEGDRLARALVLSARDDTGADPMAWQGLMPFAQDFDPSPDPMQGLHQHLAHYVRPGVTSR